MSNLIYVVEMLRWGDDETHHYVLGAYTTLAKAKLSGNAEKSWRAGKYDYRIVYVNLDQEPDFNIMGYHKECTYIREAI